jgi:hypothetical protein
MYRAHDGGGMYSPGSAGEVMENVDAGRMEQQGWSRVTLLPSSRRRSARSPALLCSGQKPAAGSPPDCCSCGVLADGAAREGHQLAGTRTSDYRKTHCTAELSSTMWALAYDT